MYFKLFEFLKEAPLASQPDTCHVVRRATCGGGEGEEEFGKFHVFIVVIGDIFKPSTVFVNVESLSYR